MLTAVSWSSDRAISNLPNGGGLRGLTGGSNSTPYQANLSAGCPNCSMGVVDPPSPIPVGSIGGSMPSRQSAHSAPPAIGVAAEHYWLFGDYTGSPSVSTDVYMSVVVPNIGPRSGDLYYEELSIFDSAGHYDQIGITSDYNTGTTPSTPTNDWQTGWESATNCGRTLTYGPGGDWDPDAGSLNPGQAYTFEMVISDGVLYFNVYLGDGLPPGLPLVYTNSTTTTATSFLERSAVTCGGTSYYDYADIEEVRQTNVQAFPNWDFNFSNNHASGLYSGPWTGGAVCDTSLPQACPVPFSPHNYYVWTKSGWAFVEIANQAFSFQNTALIVEGVFPGQQVYGQYETDFLVGGYCLTNTCYSAGAFSVPSGWTGSVSFSGYITSQPAVASIAFTVPSNAAVGSWAYLWIQLQLIPPGGGGTLEFTSMDIYVEIL